MHGLRLFALAFRFPAAIVNGLLSCNVVTFFVAIAAKQKNPAYRRIGRGTPKPQALPVHPWSEQHGPSRSRSGGAQIFSRRFAGPPLHNSCIHGECPLIDNVHARLRRRAIGTSSSFLEKGSETCAPSVTRRSGPGRRPSVDWRDIDMNWNDVKVCSPPALPMSALDLGFVRHG